MLTGHLRTGVAGFALVMVTMVDFISDIVSRVVDGFFVVVAVIALWPILRKANKKDEG